MVAYRAARAEFLASLGIQGSGNDPLAEFSERLVVALVGVAEHLCGSAGPGPDPVVGHRSSSTRLNRLRRWRNDAMHVKSRVIEPGWSSRSTGRR